MKTEDKNTNNANIANNTTISNTADIANNSDTAGAADNANASNNTTELVFILDKSGSMGGMESDVIGGFNSMIEKQKKLEGKVYVSTVMFANLSEVVHDRIDLKDVKPMTEADYCVGGCTALLDAIGDAVHHISNIHKYARPEDVPAHTLFFINTDGMENASRRYSSDDVKKLISMQEEKGWEFLFIAAGIDAVETAKDIGIRADRSANYEKSKKGMNALYDTMSNVTLGLRANCCIASDWADNLRVENLGDMDKVKKKKK